MKAQNKPSFDTPLIRPTMPVKNVTSVDDNYPIISKQEYLSIVIKRVAARCNTLTICCCCLPIGAGLATLAGLFVLSPAPITQPTQILVITGLAVSGCLLFPYLCTHLIPWLSRFEKIFKVNPGKPFQ